MKKDALLKIVKAARMSMRLAADTEKLTVGKTDTWAGEIAGLLTDTLSIICHEKLSPYQDFDRDSMTMQLLRSYLSDEKVTDVINDISELPPPHIVVTEEKESMYAKNGGYMYRGGDAK